MNEFYECIYCKRIIARTEKTEKNFPYCSRCKPKEKQKITGKKQEKTKVIILDNNELSISKYQEEFGDLKWQKKNL